MAMNEEARKCVQALQNSIRNGFYWIGNAEFSMPCKGMIHLIESLSAQLDQVTRERDAAVEDAHGVCKACIHYNGHYPPGEIMSCCKFEECVHGSDDWDSEDHWQWRGVEVEG